MIVTLMAYDSCEHDGNFEDIHDSNFILKENSVDQQKISSRTHLATLTLLTEEFTYNSKSCGKYL